MVGLFLPVTLQLLKIFIIYRHNNWELHAQFYVQMFTREGIRTTRIIANDSEELHESHCKLGSFRELILCCTMHIGLIHMDGDDLSRAGEEPSGGLRIAVINPLPAHFHLGTFLNTSEQP